jgi:hypothetical protein
MAIGFPMVFAHSALLVRFAGTALWRPCSSAAAARRSHHAVLMHDGTADQILESRKSRRVFTREQTFATEELTNYAAHAALVLRDERDKDPAGRLLCCVRRGSQSDDDLDFEPDEFSCDLSGAFRASLRPANIDPNSTAIDPTEFAGAV